MKPKALFATHFEINVQSKWQAADAVLPRNLLASSCCRTDWSIWAWAKDVSSSFVSGLFSRGCLQAAEACLAAVKVALGLSGRAYGACATCQSHGFAWCVYRFISLRGRTFARHEPSFIPTNTPQWWREHFCNFIDKRLQSARKRSRQWRRMETGVEWEMSPAYHTGCGGRLMSFPIAL